MSDLPPLDQQQSWVVVGANEQVGPYTMDLLIDEVVAGRLADSTPVWWPALTDWTTMATHPAVAAEIARRRSASTAAPGWAPPTQQAPAAQTFAPPVEEAVADAEILEADSSTDPNTAADITDAEIVEVSEVVTIRSEESLTEATQARFASLVHKSARRAVVRESVAAVDEQFVQSSQNAAESSGFGLDDRADLESSHELRFGNATGDLLVISLGRIAGASTQDARASIVPLTVSFRTQSTTSSSTGPAQSHGEVVVSPDEWTGQATSSVSLFLGAEDYVSDDLVVDTAALSADIAATVAVVRSRLG